MAYRLGQFPLWYFIIDKQLTYLVVCNKVVNSSWSPQSSSECYVFHFAASAAVEIIRLHCLHLVSRGQSDSHSLSAPTLNLKLSSLWLSPESGFSQATMSLNIIYGVESLRLVDY